MKHRLLLPVIAFITVVAHAQVRISISDPNTWNRSELEPYVGQTVIFDDPLVVSSNANGYTISPRRIFRGTNQARPGKEAERVDSLYNISAVSLTNVSGYHRCGEKIYNLKAKVVSTGSLSMIDGEWVGNKRKDLENSLPDVGDYRLLVCGFNLENYFVENLGSNYLGANSLTAHQAQQKKVSAALKKINADIFGLVELEQGDAAIREIVTDLNENLPGRDYHFFHDAISGSSQKSDYVYDANVVEPIGYPYENDTKVKSRKKLLCFREKATGEKFIFSINHFKAKSNPETANNGQGMYNEVRVEEANSVISYYRKYYPNKAIQDKDLLVMGDLNSYAKEDPINVLLENELIDLHRAFHADSSYSYQYKGKAGYLDHALCNGTLRPQITGVAAYHINSDEDDYYNYTNCSRHNDYTMFRCSDHDPVLVGLKLDSTMTYDPSPNINTAEILSGDAPELIITDALKDNQPSFYAIYTIQGLLIERKQITEEIENVPLPLDAGTYILYLYSDGHVYQRKLIVR